MVHNDNQGEYNGGTLGSDIGMHPVHDLAFHADILVLVILTFNLQLRSPNFQAILQFPVEKAQK